MKPSNDIHEQRKEYHSAFHVKKKKIITKFDLAFTMFIFDKGKITSQQSYTKRCKNKVER